MVRNRWSNRFRPLSPCVMTTRQSFFAVTTACLVTVCCTWWSSIAAVDAAQLDLVLVHANDMHSRFDENDVYCNECFEEDAAGGLCYGGFARIAEFVEDARREAADLGVPSLFAVAGDTFQGSSYYSLFKWRPVVDFINQLRPDVMTLGNHEFDDGISTLVSYLNGTKNIPTVISNLNTTAEPSLNDFLLSSYIFTLNNTKVGIVGYVTTDIKSSPNVGAVGFYDEVESIKKETKKLRDSGVNIIIGLGHSGIEKDIEIAKEVEDIDLIVGGHSHTFLYSGEPPSIEKPFGPYPYNVKNHKNKTVPILQAYANTKYIGKVYLKFDSNGELISINGSPTLLNHDRHQDPAMMVLVDQWKQKVMNVTSVTIGRTTVDLINNCNNNECNLGNLITDAYVYYNIMKKQNYNEYWSDAPIGIINCGGIRTSIIETNHNGIITMGQLLNVMPYMDTLVKITISGSSLLEAFEHSVSNLKHDNGRHFLQVSGVQVKFDLTLSPGHRVTSLYLRCGRCRIPKFEPLVLSANYTIMLNSYLTKSGSYFESFKKTLKTHEIMNIEYHNAVAIYINATSPIMTGIEGRITMIRTNNEKSKASNINIQNCQLLIIFLSILMFINL